MNCVYDKNMGKLSILGNVNHVCNECEYCQDLGVFKHCQVNKHPLKEGNGWI